MNRCPDGRPHGVDVLILGAGPAGAALAIALKRAGVGEVLLVDRPSRQAIPMGEAAAPGLEPLLWRLGLDTDLESRGHRSCHGNRSLWGAGEAAVEDFMRRPHGRGWRLDRAAFDAWLCREAVAAGAGLLSPARLGSALREGEEWRVEILSGAGPLRIKTRWIVDSTGRRAALARRLGARLHRFDRLIALAVLALPTEGRGFEGFSLIESAELGWWYGARLPGGEAVLALMTDSDLARSADLRSPARFNQALAATREISHFARLPAGAVRPQAFAAGTQFVDRAIGAGWLAIGDALMAFDPLCAAGVTGALEDALAAGDTVKQLLADSDGVRALDLRRGYAARADAGLRRYVRERRGIYALERRWAESSFWRRRAMAPEVQTARPAR
jgi:flavin-dependent dehydrogenase